MTVKVQVNNLINKTDFDGKQIVNGKSIEAQVSTDLSNGVSNGVTTRKSSLPTNNDKQSTNKTQIVWLNVVGMTIMHLLTFYGIYLSWTRVTSLKSAFWFVFMAFLGTMGVQAGAHRLWAHKAYKANLPLRIILMVFQTLAMQNDILEWCRDHRVHHRFSETDADPHNAKRGFFFAHMGWLLVKKHPDVRTKGKSVDMSDLLLDPVVRFQHRYYTLLVILIWGVIPCFVPVYYFNESIFNAFVTNVQRYLISLHLTWFVNSAAHLWGHAPYDTNISPRESMVHLLMGEGYHNYHHTFPWDYAASEFGAKDYWNPATAFIDMFAVIGWAYDLKKVDKEAVLRRIHRTGDAKALAKGNYANSFLDWLYGTVLLFIPIWLTVLMQNFINCNGYVPMHMRWQWIRDYPWLFESLY